MATFPWRVVGIWNERPEDAVEPCTITKFKNHLDGYIDRKSLKIRD